MFKNIAIVILAILLLITTMFVLVTMTSKPVLEKNIVAQIANAYFIKDCIAKNTNNFQDCANVQVALSYENSTGKDASYWMATGTVEKINYNYFMILEPDGAVRLIEPAGTVQKIR